MKELFCLPRELFLYSEHANGFALASFPIFLMQLDSDGGIWLMKVWKIGLLLKVMQLILNTLRMPCGLMYPVNSPKGPSCSLVFRGISPSRIISAVAGTSSGIVSHRTSWRGAPLRAPASANSSMCSGLLVHDT